MVVDCRRLGLREIEGAAKPERRKVLIGDDIRNLAIKKGMKENGTGQILQAEQIGRAHV